MLPGNIDLTENLDFRNVKKPKEHHPGPALPYKSGITIAQDINDFVVTGYDRNDRDSVIAYMSNLVYEINLSDYIEGDDYLNNFATSAHRYQTTTYEYGSITYHRTGYDYYTIDQPSTTYMITTNWTDDTGTTSWNPSVRYTISENKPEAELVSIFGKHRNPEYDPDDNPALCWGSGLNHKDIDKRCVINTKSPWHNDLVRGVEKYFKENENALIWERDVSYREFDEDNSAPIDILDKLPYLSNMTTRERKAYFDELYDVDMSRYLTDMNWLGIRDIETSIATIA